MSWDSIYMFAEITTQSSETEFSIQAMTFQILLHDATLLSREKTDVNCYAGKLLSCPYTLI